MLPELMRAIIKFIPDYFSWDGEKQLLTKYLDTQYKDIMENFDSKILRFRKKYKVVLGKDSGLEELLE